jgi:hypothetical protein
MKIYFFLREKGFVFKFAWKLECLNGVLAGIFFFLFLQSSTLYAATWYLSPSGSDSNNGSAGAPLATLTQAQSLAAPGDTVMIDAGTYNVADTINSIQDGVYAVVNLINKNGITYEAIPGSRPVFNFSGVTDPGYRIAAFWVTASGVTFQGFDVTGVQETITGANNQSVGMAVFGGSNCDWNQVNVHDGDCAGFYLEKVSANDLFYQCDSYNNTGIDSGSYGNADGFGCHPDAGGTGNVYQQCRSWNNSDNGYDCINAAEPVTFDHCWSYLNGNNGGNGNGFIVGGWGSQPQNEIPDPLPVHTVEYCLSACNLAYGFYANHQPGQAAYWTYNTAYDNNTGFNMQERTTPDYTSAADQTNANDIAGVDEVMHDNLVFGNTYADIQNLNETGALVSDNSWTENIILTANDFESTACGAITQARQSDGSLPNISFMVPVCDSSFGALGCFSGVSCTPTPTPPAPSGKPYVYSNPSSGPSVIFVYNMQENGRAQIVVLNDAGEVVATINDTKPAGVQQSQLDIQSFASGHYFYRVVLIYNSGQKDAFAPEILAVKK